MKKVILFSLLLVLTGVSLVAVSDGDFFPNQKLGNFPGVRSYWPQKYEKLREELSNCNKKNKELQERLDKRNQEIDKAKSELEKVESVLTIPGAAQDDLDERLFEVRLRIENNYTPLNLKIPVEFSIEEKEILSLMLSDEQAILKKCQDYEKLIKKLKGKKIITVED